MFYDHAIDFSVYFGQQCNTTLLLVEAMNRLRGEKLSLSDNFYEMLAEKCIEIKLSAGDEPNRKVDTGSGREPRFQGSQTRVFGRDEVILVRDKMKTLIHESNVRMSETDTAAGKLEVVLGLQKDLGEAIRGVRELRAQVMIQLMALIGLLSLDFLNYIPVHMTGGCKKFIEDYAMVDSFDDREALIGWNVKFVEDLRKVFGTDLTYSMFENVTCLSARSKEVNDLFYHLPWYGGGSGGSEGVDEMRMQLCFAYNSDKDTLDAFDGVSRKVMISGKNPEVGMISWPRCQNGRIRSVQAYKIDTGAGSIYDSLYKKK